MKYSNLKVDNLKNSIGIDNYYPRFSFKCNSDRIGAAMTGWHIIVSQNYESIANGKGEIWNSGMVSGKNCFDLRYEGQPLQSNKKYYWRVKIKDEKGREVNWSDTAYFQTGIMSKEEWTGKFIGLNSEVDNHQPSLLLRREFNVNKSIENVKAYICGLGIFVLKINGQRISDSYFNPTNTQYEKRPLYLAFDITEQVKSGNNASYIELGNGFYNEDLDIWNWEEAPWRDNPKLLMEIWITYADGTIEKIVTDENFKVNNDGPTRQNSIYYGETFDANKYDESAELADYDDSNWQQAEIVKQIESCPKYQAFEPIRIIQRSKPVEIIKTSRGTTVIKSLVMTTGWVEFKGQALKDTKITLFYGEKFENETIMTDMGLSHGIPLQVDTYIFRGEGLETFNPEFCYKGFQYVEISGYPGEITQENVDIITAHNDVDEISEFTCSNKAFNILHQNMIRTILNNFHGKPTDTPVYEKNGWAGDANVAAEAFLLNLDCVSFLRKFMQDFIDCQLEDGLVPIIAPTAGWGCEWHPVWNSVLILVNWEIYRYTGHESHLFEMYVPMKKLAHKFMSIEKNGYIDKDDLLSDWLAPVGDTNKVCNGAPPEGSAIVSTAYIYQSLIVMSQIAEIIGNNDDVVTYRDFAHKIKNAFNTRFYNIKKGIYETGLLNMGDYQYQTYRQTSNIIPLVFDMVPDEYKENVVKNLVGNIKEIGYKLDTGMAGTKYILPVLSDYGYIDVAYKVANNKEYPGWGYFIKSGATSMWENWESTARSLNHYFFGTIDDWFIKYVAGIKNVKKGFKEFDICPNLSPNNGVDFVKYKLETIRGLLFIEAKESDQVYSLKFQVPFSCKARVFLPKQYVKVENLAQKGFELVKENNKYYIYQVKSGEYTIELNKRLLNI